MSTSLLRFCLLSAVLASGTAAAQIKPVQPVEPKPVPAQEREPSQIQRVVERAQTATTRLRRGPYAGTMDCVGGGMDVNVQVLRMNVEHYAVEMTFEGANTQAPGTCSVTGGFRPEGLVGGKGKLSFSFPLAQLRELSIVNRRLEDISTLPRDAGLFINAAVQGGWFRLRVREVVGSDGMPLYLVDEIIERRLGH